MKSHPGYWIGKFIAHGHWVGRDFSVKMAKFNNLDLVIFIQVLDFDYFKAILDS